MMVGTKNRLPRRKAMANNSITSRGADVQEALLNAPDFLEEIVRSEAAGDPGGGDDRTHRGRAPPAHRFPHRTPKRIQAPHPHHPGGQTQPPRPPEDRKGTFSTKLFARYQRSEKALVLSLMEMYVRGVSTRRVAKITEELCGTCLLYTS